MRCGGDHGIDGITSVPALWSRGVSGSQPLLTPTCRPPGWRPAYGVGSPSATVFLRRKWLSTTDFAERFDGVVERRARRTSRLDEVIHCLAIALGGRPAAALSRRLNVQVSNDTLLRIVRRRGAANFTPPTVVGIDDWAWKRNHRYGTLLCDLERRRTIALLPDREPATAQAWLARQLQICVAAQDRGGA
jgi:hypothetical protein